MGRIFKIALALFLIGVGIVAAFAALSDEPIFASIFNTVNEDDFEYNELVYDADEFTNFEFNFENRDFIIRPSTDGSIKITYYTTEKDVVYAILDGDTLDLTNEVEWLNNWFMGFNFAVNDDFYDVYVYLPATIAYDLKIDTSNGTLDMNDIDNVETLDFDTSNGNITIDNVSVQSMIFDTSNGAIRLTDVTIVGDLEADTSNGRIYLTNVVVDNIDCYTSNGRIIGVNVDCDSIKLRTSNGSIELELAADKADYEVKMSTSNGDLTYDGIGVTSERFNEGAQYLADLHTSNGDITIDFTE